MEIIVEIGTDDQRRQIREELYLFSDIIQELKLPIKISQILVASNFDKTVNELQNTKNYRSTRGISSSSITAVAKIVDIDDGFAIVISPLLFTEEHDSQTRCFVYLHEMAHIINKQKVPSLSDESLTIKTYSHGMVHNRLTL